MTLKASRELNVNESKYVHKESEKACGSHSGKLGKK